MEKKWYMISEHGAEDRFEKILFTERTNLPNWTSMFGGFETEVELREKVHIADFTCKKCGGVVGLSYTNRDSLVEHQMCFKCDHFRQVEELAKRNKQRVIIEGNSYHIYPNTGGPFKGYGGRKFKIERFDNPGVIIETTNLWHQGEIPKIWLPDIPNNARFI